MTGLKNSLDSERLIVSAYIPIALQIEYGNKKTRKFLFSIQFNFYCLKRRIVCEFLKI